MKQVGFGVCPYNSLTSSHKAKVYPATTLQSQQN